MPDQQLHGVIQYLRRIVTGGDAANISDGQLLERFVTHRDEAAFELLVWRHSKMVLGVCRRMLCDVHAAEDAFQASFLALARRAASISKRASVGGWLYKVAYRVALEAKARTIQRATREPPLHGVPLIAATPDPSVEAEQRELRFVIDDEVNRLPEKYRAPFVLCYFEGKSNGEAAHELGCPLGAVDSRLTRARERLRHRLTRRGFLPSVGLSAVVLSESVASAGLPRVALNCTIRAALAFANGKAVPAELISAEVAG